MDLDLGRPDVQPLQPRVADPDLAGAAAAGEVRLRRRRADGARARLDGLRRRRRLGRRGAPLGALAERARPLLRERRATPCCCRASRSGAARSCGNAILDKNVRRRAGRADRRRRRGRRARASRSPTPASSWSARAPSWRRSVRVALLTREYPPEVYGGAGVHVEYLARELARLVDLDRALLGRRPRRARAWSRTAAWDALGGDAPHLAALQAMSIDLTMAAGVEGAERRPLPHLVRQPRRPPRRKLVHDIPHVATVHSLEPLRPWKAEQLGGGYALSSWCERTGLEGADAVIAVSRGDARRHPRLLPGDRPRARARWSTTASTRPSTRRTRAPTCSSGSASTRTGRPSSSSAGSRARRACRTCSTRRWSSIPRAQLVLCAGAPDTPEIGAEVAQRVERLRAERGNVIWIDEMLPKRDVIQLLEPRDGVRLPVDLRAAGDRQPRGDGLRGGGRGDGDGRHRRGRRRRRDRAARPVRAGARRRSSRVDPRGVRAAIAERVNALVADPARAAAMGRAGRERAVEAFDWGAIAEQVVDVYRSVAR